MRKLIIASLIAAAGCSAVNGTVGTGKDAGPAGTGGGNAGSGGAQPAGGAEPGGSGGAEPGAGDAVAADASADATTSPDDGGGGSDASTTRRAQVCAHWKADRADLSEGTFTGDVAACDPGDVTPPGRTNMLKILNLYRWLGDLPPVTDDATLNAKAQACAIIMDANNMLSHMPPVTWKCYTVTGAEAAGKSDIAAMIKGVAAVDLFMNDRGNDTTIGHRRWLLSSSLGPVGLGSSPAGACTWVFGGTGKATPAWVAWPARGPFPFEAMSAGGFGMTLDATGWSLQSDTLDLRAATVTVSEGGQDLPVTVNQLGANLGSKQAIRWVTNGWKSQAGHTYHVAIGGIATPIGYDVELVACP